MTEIITGELRYTVKEAGVVDTRMAFFSGMKESDVAEIEECGGYIYGVSVKPQHPRTYLPNPERVERIKEHLKAIEDIIEGRA